ncbi:MAG TPA: glycoside hydrolase family 27 protein [Tepidisphaeraceae bacterium]|jgi:alpha-galactosidase
MRILHFLALASCGFLIGCVGTNGPKNVGLAQTPPIGWNSWNAFRLNIDDASIRAQALALVNNGMKDAGYQYVVIDGGWEGYHDAQGVFHSDPKRFPDMKALCDYIHGLGLKVGIHTSPGPVTCAGHEASFGYEAQDAQTFANWGIDFIKYDWCSGDRVYKPNQMRAAYQKMNKAIQATGRPMVYSLCQYGMQHVWKWGASVGGQMWRTTGDLQSNYFQMIAMGFGQNGLEKYAGPGHWNDPDMLEVGNPPMKPEEWRTQMTLWCMLAAPLFAGNDLTKMNRATLEILTNPEVISVDQDSAGIQGHCIKQEGPLQIWAKTLHDHTTALSIFNTEVHPMDMTVNFKELGLPRKVRIRDLWQRKDLGTFHNSFTVTLPRHGAMMLKINS